MCVALPTPARPARNEEKRTRVSPDGVGRSSKPSDTDKLWDTRMTERLINTQPTKKPAEPNRDAYVGRLTCSQLLTGATVFGCDWLSGETNDQNNGNTLPFGRCVETRTFYFLTYFGRVPWRARGQRTATRPPLEPSPLPAPTMTTMPRTTTRAPPSWRPGRRQQHPRHRQ